MRVYLRMRIFFCNFVARKNKLQYMSRKFAERTKLNLSEVNREVLGQWDAEDVTRRPEPSAQSEYKKPPDLFLGFSILGP